MRQYIFVLLAILTTIAVSAGTGLFQQSKQKQPPKTNPPAVKKPAPAPPKPQREAPPAKREKPEGAKPGPKVALSLNLTRDTTLPFGRSLLIEGYIGAYNGREGQIDIKLERPGGAWGELIRIEIQNSQSKPVPGLTIRPLIRTEASILLNKEQSGWMVWDADFKAGTKLPPGTYSVVAFIDTEKGEGSGWKGKAQSPPSELTVVAAGSDLPEDGAAILALAESRLLSYQGKDVEALAACDAYLAKQPKDSMMLEEKGGLMMKAKKPAEALAAYNAALKNTEPLPENAVPEPPFDLLRKIQFAEEAVKKQGN